MRFLSGLSFLFSYLYLFFGISTFFNNRDKKILRTFLALCVFSFIWAFSYGNIFSAIKKEEAFFWYKISSIGWIMIVPVTAQFIMELTNTLNDFKKILYILIYLPAIIFLYFGLQCKLLLRDFVFDGGIWLEQISLSNIIDFLYLMWCITLVSFSILFIFISSRISKFKREKKRALIIILSLLFSLILTISFNIILPSIGIRIIPAIGHITIFIWFIAVWYSMVKYHFLSTNTAILIDKIISKIMNSYIVVDDELKIIEINKVTEELLEIEKENLLGKNITEIFYDKDEINSFFKIIKESDSFVDYNNFYLTKNGEKIPVKISGNAIRDNENDFIGALIIGHDLRQIRELEEEIANRKIIEKKLKDTIEELKQTHEKLISAGKLAAIGKLAGGIAHELNSPLGAIYTSIQTLELDIPMIGLDDEELFKSITESIKNIKDGVLKSKDIISSIVTYSNIKNSEMKTIYLDEIFEKLIIELEDFKKDGIEIKLKKSGIIIMGNQNELYQMFKNILHNSRDAILEKKSAQTTNNLIKINSYSDSNCAIVEIEDNGIGIKQEILGRVFEPFFTTKEIGKGRGLGLFIAYDIASKHNANIEILSEEGKYTKVKVIFKDYVGEL